MMMMFAEAMKKMDTVVAEELRCKNAYVYINENDIYETYKCYEKERGKMLFCGSGWSGRCLYDVDCVFSSSHGVYGDAFVDGNSDFGSAVSLILVVDGGDLDDGCSSVGFGIS